jgi:fructose-1,6-bisphosphatase/inositol monophosphatase family enzyme
VHLPVPTSVRNDDDDDDDDDACDRRCLPQEPAVGIVYNPFLDEMYKGWRGGGAYLNGKRLRVGQAKVGEQGRTQRRDKNNKPHSQTESGVRQPRLVLIRRNRH